MDKRRNQQKSEQKASPREKEIQPTEKGVVGLEVDVPHGEDDLNVAAGSVERFEPLSRVQIGGDLLRVEEGAEFRVVIEEQQAQQMRSRTVRSTVTGNVFHLREVQGLYENGFESVMKEGQD